MYFVNLCDEHYVGGRRLKYKNMETNINEPCKDPSYSGNIKPSYNFTIDVIIKVIWATLKEGERIGIDNQIREKSASEWYDKENALSAKLEYINNLLKEI